MRRGRGIAIIAGLGALAACSPAPRSSSYFEAHSDETAKVLAACKTGSHRGQECDNAQTADAKIKSNARLELYKSGFK
jgi:hypothetical protein